MESWAATIGGVGQQRLLVRAHVCGYGGVERNGWTTLSCKAAVVLQKPAIPMHFMLHQQIGRSVFVRRLSKSVSAERVEWLWLQTVKT